MSSEQHDKPLCPVEQPDCAYLEEVSMLRAKTEELSDLVHTDTLTGLFNFRHFSLVLDQEMERTRRAGQSTALVMLDLDHFKQVNDTWGHDTGNRVLVHLAEIMTQVLRKVDIPCRYGGEEFAVILPGTPLPRAVHAAQRLRLALQQTPLLLDDGRQIDVTASMGVTVFLRDSNLSADALVKEADHYLYQAKKAGRNRVAYPDLEQYRPNGQVGADEKAALFGSDES
ncbi:MAG: GGDEF domain-containing protein [Sedimenticola sp.]|nr:MAG: GGDEF domain-containing protein [Sedimenticola sp.]